MKNNRKVLYTLLIIVFLILIGISSFFAYYFYNLKDTSISLDEVIVNEKSLMSYNVKLKDNKYYQSISDNNTYMISLIDNITAYFNYSTTFTDSIDGEYSYYIVGKVQSTSNGNNVDSEIYKSEIYKYEISGNVINISNTFNIDLDKILDEYKEFLNTHGINANSSVYYEVHLNYSVFSDKINKTITNEKVLSIGIPNSDITRINIPEEDKVERKEFSEITDKDNEIYVLIMIEFLGVILLNVLIIIILVRKLSRVVSIYDHDLEKILKEYDEYIVHIKDLPDLSKKEVLFVDSFDDLVDASITLHNPINFIEIIKGKDATFMVFNGRYVYVYKFDIKNIEK